MINVLQIKHKVATKQNQTNLFDINKDIHLSKTSPVSEIFKHVMLFPWLNISKIRS